MALHGPPLPCNACATQRHNAHPPVEIPHTDVRTCAHTQTHKLPPQATHARTHAIRQVSLDTMGAQNRLGAIFFGLALMAFTSVTSVDLIQVERHAA